MKLKSGQGFYLRKINRLKFLDDFKRPLMSSSVLSDGFLDLVQCSGVKRRWMLAEQLEGSSHGKAVLVF